MTTLYEKLSNRVHSYERMVNDRARQLCAEAGLDPSLLGIHPHNAMVDFNYGRPWKGVDYSKVRKVLYLTDKKQWEASRLLDVYCNRKLAELGPLAYDNFMHRKQVD